MFIPCAQCSSGDTNHLTILHILLNIAKITTFWLKMRVPSSVTESGLKHIPEIRDFGTNPHRLKGCVSATKNAKKQDAKNRPRFA